MCFVEFLAYLCGHASVGVNRACPLTTHLYNNPCCNKPATRPFLVNTMCHPCNRVMHGRQVDIAEAEHRWMHERGACGCEVIFPGLQQPRLMKRPSIDDDENATGLTTKAAAGVGTSAGSPTFPAHTTQPNYQGPGKGVEMPLYKETAVGNNVEVAVRLGSLYGAEWTEDHAKLHKSGRCKCPVSFERYKPLDTSDCQDETYNLGRDHSESLNQTWETQYDLSSSMDSHNPNAHAVVAPTYTAYAGTSSTNNNAANDSQYRPVYNRLPSGPVTQYPYGYSQTASGNFARWTAEGPQKSLLDEILGPTRPDASRHGERTWDAQTMHYPNVGTPIAGVPIACGIAQESAFASAVEFPQPERTIAGFPIGAGPEGESHAGDFEACSLNSSNTADSPVRRRRLSSEF
ncbi:hypothetical protein F5B22DRAFT_633843 [Xylaria bambusicola]|uniref:uncharacterized protein n=1 Tax=Xylaria bambusicola TaxID=326684 RepID=UPI0020083CE0|nr:uncharacterized protein F5B22DRAFT_633843 [Xylaria bambusicola]KAI0523725.1 hypothetical protein F5B22DRAFT_633843 [Xylaria bambusicola]